MAFLWHRHRVFWHGIGSPRTNITKMSLHTMVEDPECPLIDVFLH